VPSASRLTGSLYIEPTPDYDPSEREKVLDLPNGWKKKMNRKDGRFQKGLGCLPDNSWKFEEK